MWLAPPALYCTGISVQNLRKLAPPLIPHTLWHVLFSNPSLTFYLFFWFFFCKPHLGLLNLCLCVLHTFCVCVWERERKIMEIVCGSCSLMGFVICFRIIEIQFFFSFFLMGFFNIIVQLSCIKFSRSVFYFYFSNLSMWELGIL